MTEQVRQQISRAVALALKEHWVSVVEQVHRVRIPSNSEGHLAVGLIVHRYRANSPMKRRRFEKRSYEDIAELVDLPVGTVSTYLHRARKQLQQILGGEARK